MSAFDAAGYDYGRWGQPPEPPAPPVGAPVILIPTPLQLAQGIRVVSPPEDRVPTTARRLAAELEAAGFGVRLSWALAMIPVGWERMRHQQPKRWETVYVRAWRPGLRGWAGWVNGDADSARIIGGPELGVTLFRTRMLGLPDPVRKERVKSDSRQGYFEVV